MTRCIQLVTFHRVAERECYLDVSHEHDVATAALMTMSVMSVRNASSKPIEGYDLRDPPQAGYCGESVAMPHTWPCKTTLPR